MAPQQWLDRKLSSRVVHGNGCSHDQMLAEGCGTAGAVHEVLSAHHALLVQDMTAPADQISPGQHPLRAVCNADPRDLCQVCQLGRSCAVHPGLTAEEPDGIMQVGICSVPMAPIHHAAHRKIRLACPKFAAVAFAAMLLAVLALSISFHCISGGLEISSQDHGRAVRDGAGTLASSSRQWSLHLPEPLGASQVPRSGGMEVWFMEDSILSGLMAVKASRGISMKLKTAALQEARAAVEKEKKQGHQAQAARELIGPRGGLPTLKADLIKLALLCDVTVLDTDTVPTLQAKLRPVVATIRNAEPKVAAKASSRAPSSTSAPAASPAEAKAAAAMPQAESMRSSSLELMTASQMADLMDNKLHGAILEQDQRLQTMMAQVMSHIEERFKNMPQVMMPMPVMAMPNGPNSDDSQMGQMEDFLPPQMPR